jgi:hypothetical protein
MSGPLNADGPSAQPAVSTAAVVGLSALGIGCCGGCAAVAAHSSGFPLLVIGGCACLLVHLTVAALLVRVRGGSRRTEVVDSLPVTTWPVAPGVDSEQADR